MEWQPIDTAPKYGVAVLLYRNGWCNDVAVCSYNQIFDEWVSSGVVPFVEATHWMPLPAPPIQEAEHADK